MGDFFEIFGTLIRYSDIKDFRVIQAEYIYRPTYTTEFVTGIKGFLGPKTRYVFCGMQPYAAIIDEKNGLSRLGKLKSNNLKDAFTIDVLEDVRTTIGDKFNIKAIRSRKYTCMNQSGRVFTTYLEDVPALLGRADGKFSDIRKNDELYSKLGEPIAPAIDIVPALLIHTDAEDFIFYGQQIQLEDVGAEFQRLKYEMEQFSEEMKLTAAVAAETSGITQTPKSSKKGLIGKLPKLSLPGRKQSETELPDKGQGGIRTDIAKLDRALADGILTQQEYDKKLGDVLDKWESERYQ